MTNVTNLLVDTARTPAGRASLPTVLYVVDVKPGQKYGSMEEQMVFLSQAFEAEGVRFLPLFTCAGVPGMTDTFLAKGVQTHCLDLLRFRWRTFWQLWQLMRRERIGLVHWNMTNPVANPYVWGLSVMTPGVRHFYTDHNSREDPNYVGPTGLKKACKRLLLKRYCQVWCVSEFVQNCLLAQGTWSNLHCCRHFINTDRFRPDPAARAEMRRRNGVEDRFVVTTIAQLIPAKGVDLVIRALTELPEKVILWIVGTGEQSAELQTLAQTLGLQNRVKFWGMQQHVEPFLQASDCFVLPSRWQEAAGLVILEAQAAGLPVVASRIGGIPEYVVDGRTAHLFTPGAAPELAAQLRILCADPAACSRMAQEARSLALERFSAGSQMPTLLNLYRQYCQG